MFWEKAVNGFTLEMLLVKKTILPQIGYENYGFLQKK